MLTNEIYVYMCVWLHINIFDAGDEMGLPRPPAFLDPSLTEDVMIENGVNYASGGGGILNETGAYFVS